MCKAFVFDLDGVIINSREIQIKALTQSYQQFYIGSEPPIERFFELSGGRLEDIFKQLGFPDEMVGMYRELSVKYINEINLYDGMYSLLEQIKSRKVKIGLCTGKDRKRTMQILEYLNVVKYFDAVVCSDEVVNPKPSEESLIKCLSLLQTDIYDGYMIGDAVNDILCARNANVKCIAVTWGVEKKEELIKCQPDLLVDNVEMLKQKINSLINLKAGEKDNVKSKYNNSYI